MCQNLINTLFLILICFINVAGARSNFDKPISNNTPDSLIVKSFVLEIEYSKKDSSIKDSVEIRPMFWEEFEKHRLERRHNRFYFHNIYYYEIYADCEYQDIDSSILIVYFEIKNSRLHPDQSKIHFLLYSYPERKNQKGRPNQQSFDYYFKGDYKDLFSYKTPVICIEGLKTKKNKIYNLTLKIKD